MQSVTHCARIVRIVMLGGHEVFQLVIKHHLISHNPAGSATTHYTSIGRLQNTNVVLQGHL